METSASAVTRLGLRPHNESPVVSATVRTRRMRWRSNDLRVLESRHDWCPSTSIQGNVQTIFVGRRCLVQLDRMYWQDAVEEHYRYSSAKKARLYTRRAPGKQVTAQGSSPKNTRIDIILAGQEHEFMAMACKRAQAAANPLDQQLGVTGNTVEGRPTRTKPTPCRHIVSQCRLAMCVLSVMR